MTVSRCCIKPHADEVTTDHSTSGCTQHHAMQHTAILPHITTGCCAEQLGALVSSDLMFLPPPPPAASSLGAALVIHSRKHSVDHISHLSAITTDSRATKDSRAREQYYAWSYIPLQSFSSSLPSREHAALHPVPLTQQTVTQRTRRSQHPGLPRRERDDSSLCSTDKRGTAIHSPSTCRSAPAQPQPHHT